jgi:hypothetical protein
VETAGRFRKLGFQVSFEPSIKILTRKGQGIKKPDIKLTNQKTKEEIFVEVSRLRKSDEQKTSENSFHTIWRIIHDAMNYSVIVEKSTEENKTIWHHILPYANILRDLKADELSDIVPLIIDLVNKVMESKEFHELIIPGKIEIAISPITDHSEAIEWANKRGMKDLVKSPPIPQKATHSARIKIADKITQLPIDRPGIIVIPTIETFMFFTHDIQSIIENIRTELERFPQLMCVVLTSQAGETKVKEPVIVPIEGHLFTKKTREDLVTEQKLILTNPNFNLPISKSTKRLIEQAFIEH